MSAALATLSTYLPQHEGLLPPWLLFISLVSIANSAQTYLSLAPTQQVYARAGTSSHPSPVTPLSARTFGTWTALASLVRLYAAYHIDNPPVYALAFWTFVLAGAHFGSEWWVFGSARWGRGLAGPVFVALGSGVWMWGAWGGYVGEV